MNRILAFQDLICAYVQGRISVAEFERIYIAMFKNPANEFPNEVFRILSSLFCDVDAYSPLFSPKDDDGVTTITEETLFKKSKEALRILTMYVESIKGM